MRKRPLLFLFTLAACAAFLRLYHLGRESLWLDEAATWWNATRPAWHDTIFAEGNHSPLWWILTRLFVGALGDGEFALRLPAALFGVLAVLLMWELARVLLSREGKDAGAPVWIALLACLHPFWIEYSQEARMYSALLAESLGLSLLLLSWLTSRRRAWLVFYAVLAVLALYTHPFAILTLAAHGAFLAIEWLRRRRTSAPVQILPLLLAQAAAVLLFVPWVLRSASMQVGVGTQGHYGPLARTVFSLWRLLYGPSLAAAGRTRIDLGLVSFVREEALVLLLGTLLFLCLLVFGLRALRRDPPALTFVATGILVPFLLLLAAYVRLPLLHEKYLIMTAPCLLLLVVVGARAAPGGSRPYFTAALAAWIGLAALAYLAPDLPAVDRLAVHGHPRGKEEWRQARAWVAERAGPGAFVLLYPSFLDHAWEYYDRGRLPASGLSGRDSLDTSLVSGRPQVLLVSAATRGEERERVARLLALAMAQDTSAVAPGGVHEQALFPRQWGVWTYDFVRGRPPARLPR